MNRDLLIKNVFDDQLNIAVRARARQVASSLGYRWKELDLVSQDELIERAACELAKALIGLVKKP